MLIVSVVVLMVLHRGDSCEWICSIVPRVSG